MGTLLSSQRTLLGQVMVQEPLLVGPRSVNTVNTNALPAVSGGFSKLMVVLLATLTRNTVFAPSPRFKFEVALGTFIVTRFSR